MKSILLILAISLTMTCIYAQQTCQKPWIYMRAQNEEQSATKTFPLSQAPEKQVFDQSAFSGLPDNLRELATPHAWIVRNGLHPEIWWDLVPGTDYYILYHTENPFSGEWLLCPCIFAFPPAQDTFAPEIPRRFYKVIAYAER
jgi:hypothetical protein